MIPMRDIKMEIRYSEAFRKQYNKADTHIRRAFQKRLAFFLQDIHHPLLHNHALTGLYQGFRSINITGDWRAIFVETHSVIGSVRITFVALGTHSQLYKK